MFKRVKHHFDSFVLMLVMCMATLQTTAVTEKPADGQMLMQQANRYLNYEQYSEALSLYTKALEEAEANGDKTLQTACLGNIGNVYGFMDNTERAIYYYKRGLDISAKEQNTIQQLKFSLNLTACYCILGDLHNARKYYKIQMSLPYKSDPLMRYYAYCNASGIAKLEGNYDVALYNQQKALQLVKDSNLGSAVEAAIHSDLGKIYYSAGQYQKAIYEHRLAYNIFGGIKYRNQEALVCRDLYVVYHKLKNEELAAYYKNRYLTLNDSIFDRQRMNAASARLFDYEKLQNDTTINRLSNRNLYLGCTAAMFLALTLAVAYLYIRLRQRNRRLLETQRILVEKNEELLRNDTENHELRRQYIEVIDKQKRGIAPETSHMPNGSPTDDKKADKEMSLSDEQRNRLLEQINQVLADVSVISREDFSLSMLAQMIGSNTKYVSTVINETYHKNFKSYLNEFRIKEACRRLCDTGHYGNITIQAIYTELGYKTATGFIQAFRKINGMTPSQYQKLKREQTAAMHKEKED